MRTDVLIVGFGLAGWAMTESLQKANKSFVVIDNAPHAPSSSRAATGIYNPTVLKRFRAIDRAQKLMDYSIPYYKQRKYKSIDHPNEILRVLSTTAEQNDWLVAADKPSLARFLDPTIQMSPNVHIHAPHGVGTVQQTGWIDVPALLNNAKDALSTKGIFIYERFDHASLTMASSGIEYKQWKASYVVFAEGVGILTNPWFSSLPLIPNKGEWLVISCPGLGLDQIIKGSVFIVPLGEDHPPPRRSRRGRRPRAPSSRGRSARRREGRRDASRRAGGKNLLRSSRRPSPRRAPPRDPASNTPSNASRLLPDPPQHPRQRRPETPPPDSDPDSAGPTPIRTRRTRA